MAPGRKKGANKPKTTDIQLRLGDLVLARVMGFPAWPAKISRPEDWERDPDPKKYFVQFFGTQEIAFVAHADVQAFTKDLKSELLARCKKRTLKYFPQAIKEICDALDEVNYGYLAGSGDVNGKKFGHDAEDGEVKVSHPALHKEHECGNYSDDPAKRAVSADECSQLPDFPRMSKNIIKDGTIVPNESGVLVKYETEVIENQGDTIASHELKQSQKGPSVSPYGTLSKKKNNSDSLGASGHIKVAARSDKKSANGRKLKDMKVESKRKNEDVVQHIDHARTCELVRNEESGKSASGQNGKRLSLGSKRPVSKLRGKTMKNQLKNQKHLDVDKSSMDAVDSPGQAGDGDHSIVNSVKISLKQSQSIKRAKQIGLRNDAAKESIFDNGKNILVSDIHDDETVLPPEKHHRASESGVKFPAEGKRRYVSPIYKKELPKKRKALRLSDNDDEVPKTPVHGASSSVSKSGSSVVMSMSKKKFGENHEASGHCGDNMKDSGECKDPLPSDMLGGGSSIADTVPKKVGNSLKVRMSHNHDMASFQIQDSILKSGQLPSGERSHGTPKSSMRMCRASIDSRRDHNFVEGKSLEDVMDVSGSLSNSKVGDSSCSLKDLIAAAQAKRRKSLVQNVSHGKESSAMAVNHLGKYPSPSFETQGFPSNGVNKTPIHDVGFHSQRSIGSPFRESLPFPNQLDSEEQENKAFSSIHQAAGNTLNGDTDAAVARDAFEGMIETLSRTKESIGRATRHAIVCAKHGIANEVVDLLIRKLENEASFHRRVDILFLVDSITQRSHGQKGVAATSYIPAVQAALPRLLVAAAPSGVNARENRRQCLKVLRLWHERKIFPQSVLQHYMDDIEPSNADLSCGLSLRRPSRAERSMDDPIREMEGMLDEYGSNATFNLPGLLLSRGFADNEEDEEDMPVGLCKQSDVSSLEAQGPRTGLETGNVTQTGRWHRIMEDVDGELEMEDVSGQLKDGGLSLGQLSEKWNQKEDMDTELEPEPSSNDFVYAPSFDGSPPLPLEPPPPLPPLPSSPFPPPPPPFLPTASPPPPPPPAPPSQLPLPSLLVSGPAEANNVQPLLLTQPPVPFYLPQPAFVLPQQQGSHPAQMAGNTSQPTTCFPSAGASGLHDQSACSSWSSEYVQGDMYAGMQAGLSNEQYQNNQPLQPGLATFSRGPFPLRPPVTVNQFTYSQPSIQQHMPHPPAHPAHPPSCPPPPPPSHLYQSTSQSPANWNNADNLRNTLVNGGQVLARPTSSFEGTGHSINQMLPLRPDVYAHNSWRPV